MTARWRPLAGPQANSERWAVERADARACAACLSIARRRTRGRLGRSCRRCGSDAARLRGRSRERTIIGDDRAGLVDGGTRTLVSLAAIVLSFARGRAARRPSACAQRAAASRGVPSSRRASRQRSARCDERPRWSRAAVAALRAAPRFGRRAAVDREPTDSWTRWARGPWMEEGGRVRKGGASVLLALIDVSEAEADARAPPFDLVRARR